MLWGKKTEGTMFTLSFNQPPHTFHPLDVDEATPILDGSYLSPCEIKLGPLALPYMG
jgi:hypothetical protein